MDDLCARLGSKRVQIAEAHEQGHPAGQVRFAVGPSQARWFESVEPACPQRTVACPKELGESGGVLIHALALRRARHGAGGMVKPEDRLGMARANSHTDADASDMPDGVVAPTSDKKGHGRG